MRFVENEFIGSLAHRFVSATIVGALSGAALLAGCGGGTASAPPIMATSAPSPSPTIAPQNYLPLDNQVGYEGGASPAFQSVMGSLTNPSGPPSCALSVQGNVGDYELGSSWQPTTAHSISNVDIQRTNGQFPVYIITKDTFSNVYIVGYFYGYNQTKTCVTPYLFVKSQMKAGDSWLYTDINGNTDVASVGYVGQTSSFTITGSGTHAGQSFTYHNVAQVNYGNTFSIYWSAGNGPIDTVNTVDSSIGQPNTWTAFSVTVVQ